MTKKKVFAQYGLKMGIEVHCETEEELLSHLSAIRATLKKKLNCMVNGEIVKPLNFGDNNCYGTHDVVVTEDESHEFDKKPE